MSAAGARFGDAAALFALFAGSSWQSCELRTGELEFFAARAGGPASPIGAAQPNAVAATILRAPHLGTVAELAEVGTALAAGEVYARLELLGELVALTADRDGTVRGHLHPLGALVEHDQPLLSLD